MIRVPYNQGVETFRTRTRIALTRESNIIGAVGVQKKIQARYRRRTAIAKPDDESGWHEGNQGPALSRELRRSLVFMFSTSGRFFPVSHNSAARSLLRQRVWTRSLEVPGPDHWVANFPTADCSFALDPGSRPAANVINLKLSWKTVGSGYFAKSEHGYYLAYRNIDLESKEVRWCAKFQPLSGHSLKPERWNQSQFFDSFEGAQLFCEAHAGSTEQ
jgi:hypothetical protein